VAITRTYDVELRELAATDHNNCDVSNNMELLKFKEVAIYYIAGYVLKMVEKKINCLQCVAGLKTNKESIPDLLVTWKMNGVLRFTTYRVF
jgi:hypothetical protein